MDKGSYWTVIPWNPLEGAGGVPGAIAKSYKDLEGRPITACTLTVGHILEKYTGRPVLPGGPHAVVAVVAQRVNYGLRLPESAEMVPVGLSDALERRELPTHLVKVRPLGQHTTMSDIGWCEKENLITLADSDQLVKLEEGERAVEVPAAEVPAFLRSLPARDRQAEARGKMEDQ